MIQNPPPYEKLVGDLAVPGVAEVAERTHTPPKTLWKHLTAYAPLGN